MSFLVVPPAIGVNTSLDSPKAPWHDAHFSSQMRSPWLTEPAPRGRPAKSGRTSMSQACTSGGRGGATDLAHGVGGRGDGRGSGCSLGHRSQGGQQQGQRQLAQAGKGGHGFHLGSPGSVDLHVGDFAVLTDTPRLDRVVVIDRLGAAHRPQLVDLGLHVTGLVHSARLQHGRAAVPDPVDVEAGEGLAQARAFQARGAPVAAAVGADIHALDLARAPTRPGR